MTGIVSCVIVCSFPKRQKHTDIQRERSWHAPGEAATIYVDVDGATGTKTAHIQITHLNETVWENDVTFTANGGKRQFRSAGLRRQRIIRDI